MNRLRWSLVLCVMLTGPTFATVTDPNSVVGYTGNGSSTEFAYSFPTLAATDLKVYLITVATGAVGDPLTLNSDYTATYGASGGTVTTTETYTSAYEIWIERVTPKTQTVALTVGGAFSPTVLNAAFDKLTKIVIELYNQQAQFIRADSREQNADMELPAPAVRANNYLIFDEDGNVDITPSSADADVGLWASATPSDFFLTLADDANAAELRSSVSAQKAHWFDVTEAPYNAAGDGVTDDTVAIQAATDAASAVRGVVYFPTGTYILTNYIEFDDFTTFEGSGSGSGVVIIQTTASTPVFHNADAASVSYCNWNNITVKATAAGVIGISNPDHYLAYCSLNQFKVLALSDGLPDIAVGIDAVFARVTMRDCFFNGDGTLFKALNLDGTSNKVTFASTISHTNFWYCAGDDASVFVDYANSLTFDHCVWEACDARCLYLANCGNVELTGCNFENDDASAHNNALIDITSTNLTMDQTKVQNNVASVRGGTIWDAMVYVGNSSTVYIFHTYGNMGNKYFTVDSDTNYDEDFDVLAWNFPVAYGGSLEKGNLVIGSQLVMSNLSTQGDMIWPARSYGPSTPDTGAAYIDDGTNVSTGGKAQMYYDGSNWHALGATDTPAFNTVTARTITVGADIGTPDAWYKLNDAAASTVVSDSSGNGYHMASISNTEDRTATGIIDACLEFDGTTDYAKIDSLGLSGTSGSISAWVRTDDGTTTDMIFAIADASYAVSTRYMGLQLYSSGALRFTQHNGTTLYSVTGDSTLAANQWYHVAVISDGSAWTLYVNGQPEVLTVYGANNGNWIDDTPGADNMSIGTLYQSATAASKWNGYIDDVRVYTTQLSASDVAYMFAVHNETYAGQVTVTDSAVTAPFNITERSAEPTSAVAGDTYLDDGTNTASGNPGWRRYTGVAWEDISAASGTSGASFTFTDEDASPNAAGMLKYDNTVTGLLDGALAWYDDDAVRYLVDLATLPVDDDYVVAYDAALDGFYMKADADSGGATAYDAIGNPTGVGSIEFDDTETATYVTATTATDFMHVNATGAFGDISIFKVTQDTGNPTDGALAEFSTADAEDNVDQLLLGNGADDYVTHRIVEAGTYTIDVTSDGTAAVAISDPLSVTGQISASAGVDLGTSQALVGTTAMTIGNNGQTVAINSSDWDIDATGVMTGMGNITSNGTIEGATLTEGGAGVPNVNDNLSVFAATTSAQLAGVLSDETGTGAAVLADSPTFADDITIHATGVKITGSADGDITLLGLGDGFDEDLNLNLDDTENTAVVSSTTGVTGITFTGIALTANLTGNVTGNASGSSGSCTGNAATASVAAAGDSATAFFSAGTIEHEWGGLQADVSGYTGLIAITGADTTAEIDSKTELEGQLADVTDLALANGDIFTGDNDFGGADLELPQGQTPDTDGDIDLDFTDGSVVIQHGSAHAELSSATDVVVGKLIHSFDATLAFPDLLQAEIDYWPLKAIESTEFPHGVVVTDIYLKVNDMTGYDLNVENWDDPNTINAVNGTIDNITTTAHSTDESTEDTITYATIGAGQIIMLDLPTTNVSWIYVKVEYYEPIS